jgi:DNA-binding FrmR family transcriptional regulator
MSHTSKEKLDLVNRTKKIVGQLEAALRALNQDEPCAEVSSGFPSRAARSIASWRS